MINVSILGASGYTGYELLRILSGHPNVRIIDATSRQHKGKRVSDVFPSLRGYYDGLEFTEPEEYRNIRADIVFCALPHGASQEIVPTLLEYSNRVIDLSADFRLKDAETFKAWYGAHKAPDLLTEAVYGLPELYREDLKDAVLVANPGCYPTSAILALMPALRAGLVDTWPIIIDSKSGVSGAGRAASLDTAFCEVAGGFKAYKVGNHRHTPEIEQELSVAAAGRVAINFTPHLIPASRGILTTAYATLKKEISNAEINAIYREAYANEPFVRVLPENSFPDISHVRASNYCDIGMHADPRTKRLIVVSAIDNLVKGASGQAVQNMNIMNWLKEDTALKNPPLGY